MERNCKAGQNPTRVVAPTEEEEEEESDSEEEQDGESHEILGKDGYVCSRFFTMGSN